MKKRFHPALLLACVGIVLIMFTACAAPPPRAATPAPANSIQNIAWEWVSVTDQSTNSTTTVDDPQNYTITFRDDGTLSGKADCNTFTGTYSQSSGFSIKLGATTMAACGEDSLDQQ